MTTDKFTLAGITHKVYSSIKMKKKKYKIILSRKGDKLININIKNQKSDSQSKGKDFNRFRDIEKYYKNVEMKNALLKIKINEYGNW